MPSQRDTESAIAAKPHDLIRGLLQNDARTDQFRSVQLIHFATREVGRGGGVFSHLLGLNIGDSKTRVRFAGQWNALKTPLVSEWPWKGGHNREARIRTCRYVLAA